ncbi:hypothetical protein SPRG_07148 [Saprolegnia parasitica CBS 223.65]|uniref:Uncharacterized protein n=1 Tax=Saprolegnia parasitica (strain CBS 223.65) TaxID=695850 RepID=A0A067CMW3_SAPPC|nr:hypothetical protein SPRG_07148 [Saprolegnia parasitica CBS 223.65]KDO27876.1 hypothetical protein SPRG_07148 [Saprolegnia parasitica CBS 223.65]|eukprot:XP_012201333.1 hypothetical protein SPRG_07148 [Saprolegnia parasitica CBS 223.65]
MVDRPPVDVRLVGSFRAYYQRNNKKGGLKNLRCFPTCSNGVHMPTGFCGSPVIVHVATTTTRYDVLVCAEFCPLDTSTLEPTGLSRLRDIKTTEQLTSLAAKNAAAHAPWYVADRIAPGEYSLNSRKRGWHYGWTSNRHMADTKHVLCVYVFERNKATRDCCFWTCVGVGWSPPFQLYCRRRAKARVEVLALRSISVDTSRNDGSVEATRHTRKRRRPSAPPRIPAVGSRDKLATLDDAVVADLEALLSPT